MDDELNVVVRELAPTWIVMREYVADGLAGVYSASIGELFLEVEGWLRLRGFETNGLRRIGVPIMQGGELRRYWCGIEAPDALAEGDDAVALRELAGGRYAVLTLVKDSATIGEAIGRFHSEYVPSHGLLLDPSRPAIEVYSAGIMEYCAPIQPEAS